MRNDNRPIERKLDAKLSMSTSPVRSKPSRQNKVIDRRPDEQIGMDV